MKPVIQTFLRAAAVAGLALLAGCAGVSTTQSGAIGVDRTQYMSSLVPEQALVQEAGQQYAEIVQEARAKGLLDRDPAQLSRVRAISQRLIAQTGVFRADAANWPWEVHVLSVDEVKSRPTTNWRRCWATRSRMRCASTRASASRSRWRPASACRCCPWPPVRPARPTWAAS